MSRADEIAERRAAIHWTPWRYAGPSSPDGDTMSVFGRPAKPPYHSIHILSVDADTRQEPNLVFIAHAPDDIAFLLEQNRILEEAVEHHASLATEMAEKADAARSALRVASVLFHSCDHHRGAFIDCAFSTCERARAALG